MSALSPRQMFLLDIACYPISRAFDQWGTYLVGTAVQPRGGQAPRDIDVRSIMRDEAFDKLADAIGLDGIGFLGLAIGQYLASVTGLPIDYQIQRQTEANALHDGPRNPLGDRDLSRFRGDAQTADMERLAHQSAGWVAAQNQEGGKGNGRDNVSRNFGRLLREGQNEHHRNSTQIRFCGT